MKQRALAFARGLLLRTRMRARRFCCTNTKKLNMKDSSALKQVVSKALSFSKPHQVADPATLLASLGKKVHLTDDQLSELEMLMAKVSLEEVDVWRQLYQGDKPVLDTQGKIGYIDVIDRKELTMAIFILPPGARIPLHDHYQMWVVSRILWGKMIVRQYDFLQGREGKVNVGDEILLNEGAVTSLAPHRGNVHEFEALEWTAVLDLLMPPYGNGGSECLYYQRVDQKDGTVNLMRASLPQSYNTVRVEYTGIKL